MSHEITLPDFTVTLTIDGDEYVADFADTRKLQAVNASIAAVHGDSGDDGDAMRDAIFALMPDMREAIDIILGKGWSISRFGEDDSQSLPAASLVGSLIDEAAEFYISR